MSATPEQIDVDEKALCEQVALVLFKETLPDAIRMPWDSLLAGTQETYRRMARAAITAYLTATKDAQAERVRVLEGALNHISQWDISGRPLMKNEENIPPEDFPHYVAGRAHAELALIRSYARNSITRAALRGAP